MTNRVWAIDGQTTSGQDARLSLTAPLAMIGSAARPLGARSGVRYGTGVVATVTSTTWTVRPHAGIVDAQTSIIAGPYGYAVDTAVTGAINASGAATRTDVLWVRVDDPVIDGSTLPLLTPGYSAGTSTPPARCMALGTISVPPTGNGAPTFTASHAWLPSSIVPVRSADEMNALPKLDGLYADRLDTNVLWRCDGVTWSPMVETWTGAEDMTIGPAPAAGTRKVRYSGSAKVTTTALGGFNIGSFVDTNRAAGYPGLPTGVVSYSLNAGDNFNGLDRVVPITANCTLSTINGVARDVNGAAINGKLIRVNWVAEGY